MEALNVSSRNVTPTPFGAAHFLERGRCPRLALHHLGEQGQADGDDLAFFGQPGDRLLEEVLLVLARASPMFSGKLAERPPKCHQHFLGMVEIEEIDGRGVLPLRRSRISSSRMNRVAAIQKSSRTMTTHWNVLAVALPQGCDQFRVLLTPSWHAAIARTDPGRSAPSCRSGMPGPVAMPPANLPAPSSSASAGQRLRSPFSSRASVSSGVASM